MKSVLLIWTFLYILVINGGSALCSAVAMDLPRPNLDGIPAPKRATAEKPYWCAMDEHLTQMAAISDVYFMALFQENVYLQVGQYDKAIEAACAGLAKTLPLREKSDGGGSREYLYLLAVAYELKGEWEKALDAYDTLYGARSQDALWARARVLYATEHKELAFFTASRALALNLNLSVDDAIEAVKTASVKKTPLPVPGSRPRLLAPSNVKGGLEPNWFGVWKLREHCARFVCPELYYLVTREKPDSASFTDEYAELHEMKFAEFCEFMEAEFARLQKEGNGTRIQPFVAEEHVPQMNLLRELKRVPFQSFAY